MPVTYPIKLDIYKLVVSLTEATDLISPALVNHHKQVSFIAYSLGKAIGLDDASLRHLAIAGALHDIGGLSLASRLETLEFEMNKPHHHSVSGALLLSLFKPFAPVAELIRFHHVYWEEGAGAMCGDNPVSPQSHILHLADRIAVLINQGGEVLEQTGKITGKIRENSGRMFRPDLVEAFQELAIRESFWLEASEVHRCHLFSEKAFFGTTEMNEEDILDLASLFCRIIDFRSRFTATHSSGVSAVAENLAEKAGMTESERCQMKIAGLLHDIGKLIVPQEILEKETPLSDNDYIIIRRHPYYTQRILEDTPGFDEICAWSAYHHERLDGTGYPYHVLDAEIPFGAKLLTVADTFTALTEMRPYRPSTSSRGTLKYLDKLVADNKLDGEIVSLLSREVDEFNSIREEAQNKSYTRHNMYIEELQKKMEEYGK